MIERIALVVGAGRSIGAATADMLARTGFRVALADRDLAAASDQTLRLAGSGHRSIALDVTDEQSVVDGFNVIEETLGPIAVLISCVGGPITTPASSAGLTGLASADWDATQSLNIRGSFLCLREMLRHRTRLGVPHGRIVTISSIAGQQPWSPAGAHYASSKAALLALTKFAAIEAAPLGLTVNSVAPGAIEGPQFSSMLSSETIASLMADTPAKRLGTTDDVVGAIAWLVSESAAYVTGATIDLNGGRRMA